MSLTRHLSVSPRNYAYTSDAASLPPGHHLAQLHITRGRCEVFTSERHRATISPSKEALRLANEHPDALWVVHADAEPQGNGTLTPFTPPQTREWREPLFVEASDEAISRARLTTGERLLKQLTLTFPSHRVIVTGQATLTSDEDGLPTWATLWLPNGDVLRLHRVKEGQREWLRLGERITLDRASRVAPGANTLWFVTEGAQLHFIGADEARDRAAVPASLEPPRSTLLAAATAYRDLLHAQSRTLTRNRTPHRLVAERVRQVGSRWAFHARLSPEAEDAWLGEQREAGRKVRLDQPVHIGQGEHATEVGSLDTAIWNADGEAEFMLTPATSFESLQPGMSLCASSNRGAEISRTRERVAEAVLVRGEAALPRLALLLAEPSQATPPSLPNRFEVEPKEMLDEHQRRAVQMIVGCRDLVAIQGPPGTGKTRVIVESLRQIAARYHRHDKPIRVLVSSVQNEAVDNVVERLDDLGGLVLRIIHRRAKDDFEAERFAKRLDAQRNSIVSKLRVALRDHEPAKVLEDLDVLQQSLDVAQTHQARGALTEALAQIQALKDHALLTDTLRVGIGDLSLEPPSAPRTTEQAAKGPPPLPEDPADVAAWWASTGAHIDAAHRAQVQLAVSAVAQAHELPPSRRRDKRLASAREELDRAVAELPPCTPAATPAHPRSEPGERMHAWLVTARAHVASLVDQAEASPEAIAQRFLHALERDPRAWATLVDKHGTAVAATCSMASKARSVAEQPFDWVIIDEAGRAAPNELLIPMVQGKRIVLIGDDRQLPPTQDDALIRLMEEDPNQPVPSTNTLFNQLRELLPSPNKHRLATQYRMHGDIGGVVDSLFYRPHDEPLHSYFRADLAAHRTATLGVAGNRPLVWREVSNPQTHCTEEHPAEVDEVVKLLHEYKAGIDALDPSKEPPTVAIISPYQRQRRRLEQRLKVEPGLHGHFEVKTIDSVQGREFDVVILCTTRTDGRPGFLASTNRINVAISRAKTQLVIVGVQSKLLNSPAMERRAPHMVKLVERALAAAPREGR